MILVAIFGGGVAFAMLGDKVGIGGVWNRVFAPAWLSVLPLYLLITIPMLAHRMRRALDAGKIEERDVPEVRKRIKRNNVIAAICGCLVAICVASSAWATADLFVERRSGLYYFG